MRSRIFQSPELDRRHADREFNKNANDDGRQVASVRITNDPTCRGGPGWANIVEGPLPPDDALTCVSRGDYGGVYAVSLDV